jgi:hypothetical protein
MTVRGTTELLPWILSFSPYMKVLKPRALRDAVAAALSRAANLYGPAPQRKISRRLENRVTFAADNG